MTSRPAYQAMGGSGGPGGNMRIITLDKGSAATLAEALGRLLPQMRQNPVKVDHSGRRASPAGAAGPREASGRSIGGTEEQEPKDPSEPGGKPQLDDPQEKKQAQEKSGREDPDHHHGLRQPADRHQRRSRGAGPGSGVDPPADADAGRRGRLRGHQAQERQRHRRGQGPGRGLQRHQAPANQQQQQQGFPFSAAWRPGRFEPQPAQTPAPTAIRVVADPATNSLLVRASPLDMITIRRLLDKALDTGETESKAVSQAPGSSGRSSMPTPAKSPTSSATSIREHMNNNPTPTVAGASAASAGSASSGATGRHPEPEPGCQRQSARRSRSRSAWMTAPTASGPELLGRPVRGRQEAGRRTGTGRQGFDADGPGRPDQGHRPVAGAASDRRHPGPADDPVNHPGHRDTRSNAVQSARHEPGDDSFPSLPRRRWRSPSRARGAVRPAGADGGSAHQAAASCRVPSPQRGPGFFADRVKDDPQPSLLYDPQP